jgi:hypothetical protein
MDDLVVVIEQPISDNPHGANGNKVTFPTTIMTVTYDRR